MKTPNFALEIEYTYPKHSGQVLFLPDDCHFLLSFNFLDLLFLYPFLNVRKSYLIFLIF